MQGALEEGVLRHHLLLDRGFSQESMVVLADPLDVPLDLLIRREELADVDQRVALQTARPVKLAALLSQDRV